MMSPESRILRDKWRSYHDKQDKRVPGELRRRLVQWASYNYSDQEVQRLDRLIQDLLEKYIPPEEPL